MADPREFVLIGSFTDNITPTLNAINTSIGKLKANISDLSSVTKPLKDDFKDLAQLSKDFKTSLGSQAADIREMTTALKAFRGEMGRVNRSYRAGGNRMMRQAAGAAAPTPTPTPPSGGGGGGRRRRSGMAGAVGGGVAGMQLANMMTGAVVKGFQIGASFLTKPFQYAAGAFGERIKDELTDIQSAGGLYAVDQRKNLGLFKDFQGARKEQEAINYRLAKSAAALPGATSEYVQEAKKVTDTMIGALAKNPQQFMQFGQELGAKQGDKMDSLGVVIQKFTEKAVLLGKGSGGQSKMYGMPQLLEMLVNAPKVNVQGMQKYSVLRGNPMLQAALQDAEKEIAATGAGTAARLRTIMKVLNQALPNEVVQGMKNSMDGIIEVIRSSFLDPEVGLFGLGRKLTEIGPKVDQFGRYISKSGAIVNDLSLAAKEDLSLFAVLRDSIGGFALPLSELAQILPELFDPLKNVVKSLIKFRSVAQEFYASFNQYTSEFEALAKEMGGKGGLKIKQTAGARGALLSVANLLRAIGAIDMTKYGDVSKQLQKADANLSTITGDLFKTLMSSDFMGTVGETIGNLFGSVVKMVGDMMEGATDFAHAGPFAKGLKRGWDKAQGSLGVSKVFSSLFKVIGSVLSAAFKSAPFEMSILAALTVGMPLIAGAISAGLTALFNSMLAGTAGAGIGSFLSIAAPIAAVVAALIAFDGGLENTTRQLGEVLGESGNSLAGTFTALKGVIQEVFGGKKDLTGDFDLVKAALLPITATFQLLEMSTLLLIEGFDNLSLAFIRFGNWLINDTPLKYSTSKEDRKFFADSEKDTRARRLENTNARNAARRRHDIYNTGIRYGGNEGYANKVQEDIASKQAKLSGLTKGSAEYKKINDELYSLRKIVDVVKPKPATPAPKLSPLLTMPGAKPGAAGATGISPLLTGGATGGGPLDQINQKATAQVTQAANIRASAAATTKNTVTANSLLTGIKSGIISVSNKLTAIQASVQAMSMLMLSGTMKVVTNAPLFPGMSSGSPIGGATGNLGAAASAASQSGLTMTSFFRPGSKGMHGQGRAMDFSNGVNTPQQMAFAQQMIARYGSSLAELIYTPLGFGIKNGQKVPLSFWGDKTNAMHYNHVHVAFAEGKDNGKMFTSEKAAGGWENSMVPGSVKIASVTANSGDGGGFGALTIGDINLTVHAGNVSDPDTLASLVAIKIGEAVADARAASVFV